MSRSFVGKFLFALASTVVGLAAVTVHAVDFPAGPIWNNDDAQRKCQNVCRDNNGRWTGQWHTIQGTASSVCDCEVPTQRGGQPAGSPWAEAGPLWSQFDAQRKCPDVCRSTGRTWDGNWKTTEPGRMSVCSCGGGREVQPIGAGAACRAQTHGGCSGCSVQCAPGQRATCREGVTWNDKFNDGDPRCVNQAECRCG